MEVELEPMEGEEEQGSSQPPPPPSTPPSGQAKNPATLSSDEWRSPHDSTVPPYYRNPDPEAPQYLDDMTEFYLEAARRLPIAHMPKLAGALSRGGLLLGFNDPVTNIIINAIYMIDKSTGDFGVLPPGTDPGRHAADRASYVDIARRSRAALLNFMTFYFRHLTQAQAKRYLQAARHDLALAISLVEVQGRHVSDLASSDLQPDCGSSRTKTAIWYAAEAAMLLPDPDDFVRLLASSFSCDLLDPVLNDLCRGEKLSVGQVNGILNLLRHPWSPPQPLQAPTPGTFRGTDGDITIIANIGQDLFSTTTIKRDRAAAFRNDEIRELVTTTTISRHPSRRDDYNDWAAAVDYLSKCSDVRTRLCAILSTNTALQRQPDMSLPIMRLLETIHGFYIAALAKLPSDHQPRLLHAVLAGGHCFGIMDDPVHNIIINSIWYNLHYLPPKDATVQIHHTRSMTPIVSCSLHGLIASILASSRSTEQEAVLLLIKYDCFLCAMLDTDIFPCLLAAARAAKHPQPADLVQFMMLLFPYKDALRSLMITFNHMHCNDFETMSKIIADASAPAPRTPDPCQPALMDSGSSVQAYVREKLEELLLTYGRKDPLGPQYKLGIICGVASKRFSSYHRETTCYHANFLASTSGEVYGCSLFFAQFWDQADENFGQSKRLPVCCCLPPRGEHLRYHCRCFICESSAIRVVHPPDGNYFMGHEVSTDALCEVAKHEAALGAMKVVEDLL